MSMTEQAADWVRTVVWPDAMRKVHADTPGFLLACPCEYGPTGHCKAGRHRECDRGVLPLDSPETYVLRPGGVYPAEFADPTPHRARPAVVWLADRVCRWRCPCPCHRAAPPDPIQLDLFPKEAR